MLTYAPSSSAVNATNDNWYALKPPLLFGFTAVEGVVGLRVWAERS